MKRSITLLTVLLAFAIFVMPTHAKPPAPYVMEVEVVNDASNPVPITGDINVITNGIPFQLGFSEDPVGIDRHITTYLVPADKKLVIEFASASVSILPVDIPIFSIETSVNGTSAKHYIMLVKTSTVEGDTGGALDYFLGSQQMRLYADPETTVTIIIKRFNLGCSNGGCPGFSVFGSISGYLKEID